MDMEVEQYRDTTRPKNTFGNDQYDGVINIVPTGDSTDGTEYSGVQNNLPDGETELVSLCDSNIFSQCEIYMDTQFAIDCTYRNSKFWLPITINGKIMKKEKTWTKTTDQQITKEPISQVRHVQNSIGQLCQYCGKEFTISYDYVKHLQTHRGQEPYQCICGMGFLRHYHLTSHKRCCPIIISEKILKDLKHRCEHCPKIFKTRLERVQHIKLKHKCEHCPKIFKSHKQKVQHIRLHEYGSVLRCPTCGMIFKRHQILAIHQDRCIAQCICFICLEVFSSYNLFEKHFLQVHPDDVCNWELCVLCGCRFRTFQEFSTHFMESHKEYTEGGIKIPKIYTPDKNKPDKHKHQTKVLVLERHTPNINKSAEPECQVLNVMPVESPIESKTDLVDCKGGINWKISTELPSSSSPPNSDVIILSDDEESKQTGSSDESSEAAHFSYEISSLGGSTPPKESISEMNSVPRSVSPPKEQYFDFESTRDFSDVSLRYLENAGKYLCFSCFVVCDSPNAYKKHLHSHFQDVTTCHYCQQTFVTKSRFHAHLKSCIILPKQNKLKRLSTCHICLQQFVNVSQLQSHFLGIHPNIKWNWRTCTFCEDSHEYKAYNDFSEHYIVHHVKLEEPDDIKPQADSEQENMADEVIDISDDEEGNIKQVCEGAGSVADEDKQSHSGSQSDGDVDTDTEQSEVNDNEYDSQPDNLDEKSVEKDLQKHRHTYKYNCPKCKGSYRSNYHLYEHVKKCHKSLKTVSCSSCKEQFPVDATSLRFHRITHHSHEKEFGYKCLSCQCIFFKIPNLIKHSRQKHPNLTFTQCNKCNMQIPIDITSLKNHVHVKKANLTDYHPVSDYECHLCYTLFPDNKALKQHMMQMLTDGNSLHRNNTRVKCKYCGIYFPIDDSSLHQHILNIHKNNSTNILSYHNYKCHVCKVSLLTNKDLWVHVRHEHKLVNSLECKICNNVFELNAHTLGKHMVDFHKIKEPDIQTRAHRRCPICYKTFLESADLVRHEATHTMKYQCMYCNMSFLRQCHVDSHQNGCAMKHKTK